MKPRNLELFLAALVSFAVGCADSTMTSLQTPGGSDAPNATPGTPGGSPLGDLDGDGVVDREDNCANAFNPGQEDADRDAVGDACDNCVNTANINQTDANLNGIGDDCESGDAPDADGDGIADAADNCWQVPNPDQADRDFDRVGDACDNCADASNPGQADHDNDGLGNACDPDYSNLCYSETFNPDVATIEPAMLLMLDASGSMSNELDPARPRPWPIDLAQNAIGDVADALATEAWIGVSQFPNQASSGSTCTTKDHLAVRSNTAQSIKTAVNAVTAIGNTPTGYALNSVLDRGLLDNGADPYDARRPKGVILITDGDPTVACDTGSPVNLRVEAQPEAVRAAQRLSNAGIPVYVIGFMSGAQPANLNEIAAAGGTDAPGPNRFYVADDPQALVQAVQAIRQQIVSCTYQLGAVPNDMTGMAVSVDGVAVAQDPANGYSYDPFARLVTLNGASCDGIRNAPNPAAKTIRVDITCADPDECQPATEVCDGTDNDCDNLIDEHGVCDADDGGATEICNGVDDDLDGQIDEGCPLCRVNGDVCATDADCCYSACNNGTCTPMCKPAESPCNDNADCCSGACSGSAVSPGVCLAQ